MYYTSTLWYFPRYLLHPMIYPVSICPTKLFPVPCVPVCLCACVPVCPLWYPVFTIPNDIIPCACLYRVFMTIAYDYIISLSYIVYRISHIVYRVTFIVYRVYRLSRISYTVYRVSYIVYRTSCIVYRISCIVYCTSCIVYRVYRISYILYPYRVWSYIVSLWLSRLYDNTQWYYSLYLLSCYTLYLLYPAIWYPTLGYTRRTSRFYDFTLRYYYCRGLYTRWYYSIDVLLSIVHFPGPSIPHDILSYPMVVFPVPIISNDIIPCTYHTLRYIYYTQRCYSLCLYAAIIQFP